MASKVLIKEEESAVISQLTFLRMYYTLLETELIRTCQCFASVLQQGKWVSCGLTDSVRWIRGLSGKR